MEQIELVKELLKTDISSELKDILEKQFPEVAKNKYERITNILFCLVRDKSYIENDLKASGLSREEILNWLERLQFKCNPYKIAVQSILRICKCYDNPISSKYSLIDDIRSECKNVLEYDSLY